MYMYIIITLCMQAGVHHCQVEIVSIHVCVCVCLIELSYTHVYVGVGFDREPRLQTRAAS